MFGIKDIWEKIIIINNGVVWDNRMLLTTKHSYRYHPDPDYIPIIAHPEVFSSLLYHNNLPRIVILVHQLMNDGLEFLSLLCPSQQCPSEFLLLLMLYIL